jgi:hypothetical protein
MKGFPHGKRTVGYVDEMRRAPGRDIDRFDDAGAGYTLIVILERPGEMEQAEAPKVVRREYYRGSVV